MAESASPAHQRSHQFTGRPALHGRATGRGTPAPGRCAGANLFRQGNGLRRGLDAQVLGQSGPQGGVDPACGAGVAQRQVDTHEAPAGLLRQRINGQPARERGARLLQLPAFLLPGREPIQEEVQAHLPLLLRLKHPLVKGGLLPQPEAVEERAAHQGERLLKLRGQGGALRLGGERGVPLGLGVGLLHHAEV